MYIHIRYIQYIVRSVVSIDARRSQKHNKNTIFSVPLGNKFLVISFILGQTMNPRFRCVIFRAPKTTNDFNPIHFVLFSADDGGAGGCVGVRDGGGVRSVRGDSPESCAGDGEGRGRAVGPKDEGPWKGALLC